MMSHDKRKTTTGFSGGILWEMLLAFSGIIAFITFIVILLAQLHTRAVLHKALLTATMNALAGFGITALSLIVVAFGIVYISNHFEGKK